MKIYVAHASDFDYVNKLYAPIIGSELAKIHEFFLPHAEGNSFNTKEVMKGMDLLLAEVSKPSTGEGIEIGRAEAAGITVLCAYEIGVKVSSALKYVSKDFIEYQDPEDLLVKLEAYLESR